MNVFPNLRNKKIAVIGATGAVGRECVMVLEKANVPAEQITLLASKRSQGVKIVYGQTSLTVQELSHTSFKNQDIALFVASSSISKQYRDICIQDDCIGVDNSSAFRLDDQTPLIIPEINPGAVAQHHGFIANPNCSTIIMLMAVYPIHARYPIEQIIVSTYQAASGAGWEAMEELKESTKAYLDDVPYNPQILPHPYAFNLFSHNSPINDTGYNEEELKMVYETQKILPKSKIEISPTCVRVPVLRAHSESLYLKFVDDAPAIKDIHDCLSNFAGIEVIDEPAKNIFPMPIQATGKYNCFVGRIRKSIGNPKKSIELFVCGDQLLKGASLNAIQIANLL